MSGTIDAQDDLLASIFSIKSKHGLSTNAVCQLIGVSMGTWYKWMDGSNVANRNLPRLQEASRLLNEMSKMGGFSWDVRANNKTVIAIAVRMNERVKSEECA